MHTPGTRWNRGKGHSGNRVSNSVGSRKRSSQRERSGGTLFSDRGTHVRSIIDRNNIGIVPFPSRGTGFSWQSGRTHFERPFAETVEYRATPPISRVHRSFTESISPTDRSRSFKLFINLILPFNWSSRSLQKFTSTESNERNDFDSPYSPFWDIRDR